MGGWSNIGRDEIEWLGDIKAKKFVGNGSQLTNLPAAGSTTQVQFNDAGALAGDAELVWNKTNNRLGIGMTPTFALDIKGADNVKLRLNDTNSPQGQIGFYLERNTGLTSNGWYIFSDANGFNWYDNTSGVYMLVLKDDHSLLLGNGSNPMALSSAGIINISYMTSGVTGLTPVDGTTIVDWMLVNTNGSGGNYFIPLYQ